MKSAALLAEALFSPADHHYRSLGVGFAHLVPSMIIPTLGKIRNTPINQAGGDLAAAITRRPRPLRQDGRRQHELSVQINNWALGLHSQFLRMLHQNWIQEQFLKTTINPTITAPPKPIIKRCNRKIYDSYPLWEKKSTRRWSNWRHGHLRIHENPTTTLIAIFFLWDSQQPMS